MKRFFFGSLFFALLAVTALSAKTSSAPFEALRKNFSGKQGFQVEFVQQVKQEVFLSKKDQSSEASGIVKFKKPHFLEWIYEKPSRRSIVYDGKKLTTDDGKVKESVDDTARLNLQKSLSFLWGESESDLVRIEPMGASQFRVVPKDKTSTTFSSIEVEVSNGLVKSALVRDHLDGESLLRFKNWRLF